MTGHPHLRPTTTRHSPPASRRCCAWSAEGCPNGQIAERLFISRKTASVHVSDILAKLGVATRTEAAVVAHRAGLAGSPEDA